MNHTEGGVVKLKSQAELLKDEEEQERMERCQRYPSDMRVILEQVLRTKRQLWPQW